MYTLHNNHFKYKISPHIPCISAINAYRGCKLMIHYVHHILLSLCSYDGCRVCVCVCVYTLHSAL